MKTETEKPNSPVRLPKRVRESSKRDYGRLLILAGSRGYTGAPSFASRAAVRGGAGLVWLGVPESIYAVTAVKNDEAMPFPLPPATRRAASLPRPCPRSRRGWNA
ncbi:MAG: NAD(P)H-hydrate dehydratase [Lachnospiraceae bacterium]